LRAGLPTFYLTRPGADEVQLDLCGDYRSNVTLHPEFQAYFRKYKPPLLAVRGKNVPSWNISLPRRQGGKDLVHKGSEVIAQ